MIRIFLILAILLVAPAVYATSYYVDCGLGTGLNNGTNPDNAWQSIAKVNAKVFSQGDDVYFKVNTTCNPSAKLTIDWNGSSSDQAIIGAYYGNGQFGLNGNSRPIIDGQDSVPSSNETWLVGTMGYSYITVKDLSVINSGGYGIFLREGDYITVENCNVDHSYRIGIGLVKTSYSTVSDNIINDAYYWTGNGDCLDVNALSNDGGSHHNTVSRNILSNCNEGIGIYKKNDYITVEYNVIYDSDYSIYIDAGKHITLRYNMIYTSTAGEASKGRGISVDNERNRGYCYLDDIKIYGNLIANMSQGIFISNDYGYAIDTSCNTKNVLIYNNTLVDNESNIRIVRDDAGWTGNEIKNNISWTITGGTVHASNFSPTGFTWSHNLFDDAVTGNAANNAVIGDPALKKSSGWRSLTGGSVDGAEFSLQSNSDAIDEAVTITSYNDRITNSDFTADPITVVIEEDITSPDIGAWEYNEGIEEGVLIKGASLQGIILN